MIAVNVCTYCGVCRSSSVTLLWTCISPSKLLVLYKTELDTSPLTESLNLEKKKKKLDRNTEIHIFKTRLSKLRRTFGNTQNSKPFVHISLYMYFWNPNLLSFQDPKYGSVSYQGHLWWIWEDENKNDLKCMCMYTDSLWHMLALLMSFGTTTVQQWCSFSKNPTWTLNCGFLSAGWH
jgi:hypothetical protein